MAPPSKSPEKQTRKKRELFLIAAILMTVGVLTFIETRMTNFGADFPISSTILMFILINTNLLLLLALLLLVFRNLAKLYYEKKNNIFGSKLKTKLITAFIVLALLPTTVLFFFSIHFISTSTAFWFNAPVEQTLDSSLAVGQKLYEYIGKENEFFAKRAAFQIQSRKLLNKENEKQLNRYTQVIQRAFSMHAVEIYTHDARRISLSLANELEGIHFGLLNYNELTDIPTGRKSRTLSDYTSQGEYLRTVCTIPFDTDPKEAPAFIAVTALISSDLSQNLKTILKGVEEYKQLKLAKRPAQTSYYIALSIVALLVVFCAVWFGFQLAQSITIPLMKFAEGTKRVTDGDLNYQIDFETKDEIGTLIKSFNLMTNQLATGRKQIARSEKKLKKQNIELARSNRYIEIVLKNISAGVIAIDNKGVVTTMNKAAETMLNIQADTILNQNFQSVLKGEYLKLAEKIYSGVFKGNRNLEIPLSATISGTPKHFSLNLSLLKNDQNQNMGTVLVFDDVTQLEKAQRVAAWREVARRIAHEVKNPLTPIKLSAQRLKRKFGHQIDDEVFASCADTIVEHVDMIRNIVNQFSTFAKFPDAHIGRFKIETIIQETIALYREGLEHVTFKTVFQEDIPTLKLDHQYMKQAFINLIDNAVYAVEKKGTIFFDAGYDDILKIVRIEVSDTGKGISDREKTRLFEPYFSTKKTGMGLGLAIVQSIISDHNGVIRVQDNQPRGAKFIIELPA